MKSADLALYRAKADGRNCIRFFLPEMDTELQARVELESMLRDAVLHDRFELYYQPLFDYMEDMALQGTISKEDLSLVLLTDSIAEAAGHIDAFIKKI